MINRITILLAIVCSLFAVEPQQSAGQSDWNREAAAKHLDSRQGWWLSWNPAARDVNTSCVSCHTTLTYMLARPVLRERLGEKSAALPEAEVLADVTKRVARWSELEPFYSDQEVGLPKTSESRGTEAVLNALILANRDRGQATLSPEARTAFDHMWDLQFTHGEGAGSWAWLNFHLAPWETDGGTFFGATLAALAVGMTPSEYKSAPDNKKRLELLTSYLRKGWAQRDPFDRAMMLLASSELEGLLTPQKVRETVEGLIELQREDGGWNLASLGSWIPRKGFAPTLGSDAYATGLLAYALIQAGESPKRQPLRRALSWLVANQDVNGQWHSVSINKKRRSGSGVGQFMSDAATAFAVLALAGSEK